MNFKTGRLSKKEKEKIIEWALIKTPEEIGRELKRRPINIEKFLRENGPEENLGEGENPKLISTLHTKVYWAAVKDQFSIKELSSFEIHWAELMRQFNEDVEFSEEMQIVDLIRLRLLIDRNLYERNKVRKELDLLEEEKGKFLNENGNPPFQDPEINMLYQNMIMEMRNVEASYNSRTQEYKTLLEKQGAFFKELKATREQRIELIKNSKKDWVGLMKNLKEEKFRNKEGRELELMNMAAEQEEKKLKEFHKYSDNTIDRPLLNSESV